MANIKIKLDSKKLEKDLKKQFDKVIQEENKKLEIQRIVSMRGDGDNMKLLNDIEKELLRIILECEHKDFIYSGSIEQFPQYITIQIKRLFSILEECGYAAKTYCWLDGGWQVILTPLGVSYFENEEKYKMMNNKTINIGTLNANGSNVNFGNVYDSTFDVDNSYQEIEKIIDEKAEECDKEELKEILVEMKDYVDNISDTKVIGKNTRLFDKIGIHIQKYKWFYQLILNLIGTSVLEAMGTSKN